MECLVQRALQERACMGSDKSGQKERKRKVSFYYRYPPILVIGQGPLAVGSAGLGKVVARVHRAQPAACLRAHAHTTRTHSGAAGQGAAGSWQCAQAGTRHTHSAPPHALVLEVAAKDGVARRGFVTARGFALPHACPRQRRAPAVLQQPPQELVCVLLPARAKLAASAGEEGWSRTFFDKQTRSSDVRCPARATLTAANIAMAAEGACKNEMAQEETCTHSQR